MDIEVCLTKLGRTNRWIITWFLIIAMAKALVSVFALFAFQFTAVMPYSFHCNVPANISMEDFIPREYDDGEWRFSSCRQFSNFTNSSVIPCQNGYNYTLKYFTSSIVTDWDLVCERRYLNMLATSSFFVMSFLGAIVNCYIADRFGRKIVFLTLFACSNVSQFSLAFVSNVYVHIVLKLFAGIFQQGSMVIGFTMAIEFFPLQDRSMACLVDTFTWTLGCFILVVIVYFVREWRYYFITTTLIMIPFAVMYLYMPESIRWLMTKHRNEEAKILLKRAAKHSHPPLPELTFDHICQIESKEAAPEYRFTTIFRNILLLRFQLANTVIWFITALTFYGLQVKVVEIGDPFINFSLATTAEVPANVFAFPMAKKWGRKIIIGISSILVGVSIMLGYILYLNVESPWPATVAFLIGKMLNTVVFNLIFMHTSEIFPTTLRSTAVGLSTSSARLGASIGAMLFQLPKRYESTSFIFLAICCCLAGVIVFTLPETYRKKLPTTVDEIRGWVANKPFICWR